MFGILCICDCDSVCTYHYTCDYDILLPYPSHFYVGSMFLVRCLHLARSCASSPENSLSDKSFLMLSNHLLFGLPILLFPDIPISLLPTYSSSLLDKCPYHFNLLSCTFLDVSCDYDIHWVDVYYDTSISAVRTR